MKKHICIFAGLTAHALAAPSAGDYLTALSLSPVAESPWKVTGAAAIALSEGNSDNLSYSLQLLANYKKGNNEALIGADHVYSESSSVASTNNFRLFGQYNRLLTDRRYVTANASYLNDEISDIKYRIDIGLGYGYYAIKNSRTSLAFEVGPGVAWEEQGGEADSFATIRFAERFEHQLSRRSKLWQSAVFTANAEDFNDSLLNLEVGIDTLITQNWAVRTSIRYQYDNTPAAGQQSDDTTLLAGLSYALGGFPDPDAAIPAASSGGPEAIQLGWSSSASLGVSLAKGNADNLAIGLSLDSAYRERDRELFATANYTFSEDDGETSTNSLRASIQYNRIITDRAFIGSGVGFLRDDISDISYRVTPAVTAGYYVIKNDEMTLSFEAGPGYTFEEVAGSTDDYFSVVAVERFTWELSDRMTLKQSLGAVLDPSDGDNYTLVGDLLLDTDITANLAWRIALGWTFDNVPAEGRGRDDTTLTSGITVKF